MERRQYGSIEKNPRTGLIKNLRLKNRIAMAPAERCYATMDGFMTQRYIDYLVERAKNGVGMIYVESTYVDPPAREGFSSSGFTMTS